ncbi:regulatory protein RecX [Sulfobacillus harzensis]|uniref:Regulatory protein RecX n=1 Tax=Sulfobacillus harzensis TaxID=2729629 RepID=A0A7Y0L054_9FIRM|nr:regulatory protein RecX [Sulfobacillus harzensis]NMP20817.1 regulatory protein RecX [Sulfobacillus harzensis]
MPNEAKSLALRWLAQRSLSVQELITRLESRGIDADEAQAVADDLARVGFLDDQKLAQELVRRALARHEGPRRILQRLVGRGLDRSLISAVMNDLSASQDWLAIAEPIGQRYDRDNPRERARLMRRLAREGFPAAVIHRLAGQEGRDDTDGVEDY